jgi:peptidoglycan hydrolase CwlO-like protein
MKKSILALLCASVLMAGCTDSKSQAEAEQAKQALATVEKTLEGTTAELTAAQTELSTAQAELSQANQNISSLNAKLTADRQKLTATLAQISTLEKKCADTTALNNEQSKQLKANLAKQKKTASSAKAFHRKLNKQIAALKKENATLRNTISENEAAAAAAATAVAATKTVEIAPEITEPVAAFVVTKERKSYLPYVR